MPRSKSTEPKPVPVKKPRKPEFSPTRLKTYLSCRMMYRLEYIEKVGRFYHKSRAGFTFGSTLHQTLQRFHEAGGAAAVSEVRLLETLDKDWQSQGYADEAHEQEHKRAAVEILQHYHAVAASASEVTKTFLTEKLLKWDLGPFILTGRVDRIEEHLADRTLEIVDYKSGRASVSEEDVRAALAMSVYQLLVARLWPDHPVSATIHALRSGDSATVSLTDEERAALEEELRGLGIEILETDFDSVQPLPLPDLCPDCDFLRLCSRAWSKEGRPWREELGLLERIKDEG